MWKTEQECSKQQQMNWQRERGRRGLEYTGSDNHLKTTGEQGKWQEKRQREQETWTTQETDEGQVKLIRTITQEGRQTLQNKTGNSSYTKTPKRDSLCRAVSHVICLLKLQEKTVVTLKCPQIKYCLPLPYQSSCRIYRDGYCKTTTHKKPKWHA